MPARTKEVQINGKNVTVVEKKIKDLEALLSGIKNPFSDLLEAKKQEFKSANPEATEEEVTASAATALSFDDAKNALFETLSGKISEIIPEVSKDDIMEAYPSELEDLITAFIDVNFTGAKKVSGLLLNYVRGMLARN